MKETALIHALNASVMGCQPSDYWKSHMVRQIVRGEEMPKRTKLSIGVVIVIALMLVSVVALAVSAVVQGLHEYYAKITEMEQSGALSRWNLEDKINFVNAMRECGLEMDDDLYQTMSSDTLPDEKREAAADRIIDNTYGELIRNQLGYYIVEEEDSLGVAPDPIIVFQERYLAEHPEGIETNDQLREYTDALGYFLRDEYMQPYGEQDEQPATPGPAAINETYAVECLRGYMTEVLGWDPDAVREMNPTVEWDEEYGIWTVSGEVSRESMANVTDLRRGWEPSLSGFGVEETETGYRATVLVDGHGNMSMDTLDKKEFALEHRDEVTSEYREEIAPTVTIDLRRAAELAEQAVREKFWMTEEEIRVYFCIPTHLGPDENNNLVYRMDFCNHYAVDVEKIFGAVVNLGTGTVESAFTYRTDGDERWTLLEYAAQRELKEGGYIHWSPESKKELTDRIRQCGLLPEHEYWQTANPAEDQTDAFVAEAFGRKGHVSAVNTMGMAETLLGPPDLWTQETVSRIGYLSERYYIRTGAITMGTADTAEEISGDEAGRIVRAAVCRAWGMPETALDGWETVTQLIQSTEQGGMAYYRVFLTRPDSEVGQDTFGGKDNFNYRILPDGKILDSSVNPQWFSPEEDVLRWKQ